jgi:pyruvate kinase
MKRLTKIIATIGPACESEEMIAKLIEAGVNVFRFNFKHNSVEWHHDMIVRVNKVAKDLGTRVGTLIDLQGPEIRINMPTESITLAEGDVIAFGPRVFETKEKGFSISHPDIIEHLKDGQKLIADDGEFEFIVVRKKGETFLQSLSEGVLKHRKSLNVPGAEFPFPVLIDRDFDGLRLAKTNEIDYVALSFVRSKSDVEVLRKEMAKYEVKGQIIAKIETQKALDDLDNIIEAADGAMVARGDLGVEIALEQVPFYQKKIIKSCIERGKAVITATQMLQTMTDHPQPTRAEISDVANAAYDLTDAVMLSGETANGKYPVKTVNTMRKTIEFNETKFIDDTRTRFNLKFNGRSSLLCDAAYDLYLQAEKKGHKIAGFVVFTESGKSARTLATYRPNIPIFAFCSTKEIADSFTVRYGVYPVVEGKKYKENVRITHSHVLAGLKYLTDQKMIKKDEYYIVLHGDYWAQDGGITTVKLIKW